MPEEQGSPDSRSRRADSRRNEQALLDAAAAVFLRAGVDAPVRDVAAEAGVGVGTVYGHFPSRADLIVAVYRHQLDDLVSAGAAPSAPGRSGSTTLRAWIGRFVDFLVTKHGLADALRADQPAFASLHSEFLDRLLPVCEELLHASAAERSTRDDVRAHELLRAIGNLCIGSDTGSRYDPRRMVDLLLDGLLQPQPTGTGCA